MKKYIKDIIHETVEKDFIKEDLMNTDSQKQADWIVDEIITQIEMEDADTDEQIDEVCQRVTKEIIAKSLGISIESVKKTYLK